eukprot:1440322-Prymnesium_polylepis.1
MVRRVGEEGAPSDGECVKAAVAAAERAIFDGLGFHMTIEHKECADRHHRAMCGVGGRAERERESA